MEEYKKLILKELRREDRQYTSELLRNILMRERVNISYPTVKKYVLELEAEGIVELSGYSEGGGRGHIVHIKLTKKGKEGADLK